MSNSELLCYDGAFSIELIPAAMILGMPKDVIINGTTAIVPRGNIREQINNGRGSMRLLISDHEFEYTNGFIVRILDQLGNEL